MNIRNNQDGTFVCVTGLCNRFEKVNKKVFVVNADNLLEAKYKMNNITNSLVAASSKEVYDNLIKTYSAQSCEA